MNPVIKFWLFGSAVFSNKLFRKVENRPQLCTKFFESDMWTFAVNIKTAVPIYDNLKLLELTSEIRSSSITIYPRLLLQ